MKTTRGIFRFATSTFALTGRICTSSLVPLLSLLLVLTVSGTQGAVVFATLYSFTGTNDGANPRAALVQGRDGNFYGTTSQGGGTNNAGTVFRISPNGAFSTLYSFTGTNDGANPNGLVQGSDGNFYGTTSGGGGTKNWGTVFKIAINGALTTLYGFGSVTNASGVAVDGSYPNGLVQGSDGYFYGTTYEGGSNDYGTVFKISTNGALTTLYSFGSVLDTNGWALDGASPEAALVQGSDGNFYGTTSWGATNNWGTVFKISTHGVLTSLYSFGSVQDINGTPLDGAQPFAALVQGSDSNFYGTTSWGGTNNSGTVFRVSPDGALITLCSFLGGNNGRSPNGLAQGGDGCFYGTTFCNFWTTHPVGNGTVFRISPNGAFSTLYSFTGTNDGANPNGLVQGDDGNFYGTTYLGGTYGAGTVFRLTIVPDPQLTIIPSGPYVILTWPTDYNGFSYAGYTLQSTTNLGSSAIWGTNLPPPVVVNGQLTVTNPIAATRQFFRLSQ